MNNKKDVYYFGLHLSVDKSVKYIAADSDGRLYGFTEKPYLNIGGIWVTPGIIFYIKKSNVKEYTKTLRKV